MKPLAPVAVAVITGLLLLGACGSDAPGATNSPEGAVRELMASLEAGSCPRVQSIVVTPDAIDCEMVETLRDGYADDGVDLDDADFSAGEVVDGSATVTVDLGDGEDDQAWQVERVGDSWKVLFDSEA